MWCRLEHCSRSLAVMWHSVELTPIAFVVELSLSLDEVGFELGFEFLALDLALDLELVGGLQLDVT